MPTNEQYQETQDLGLPPYMWIPPKDPSLLIPCDCNQRDITFEEENLVCRQIEGRAHERFAGEEHLSPDHANLEKIPNPLSDHTHVDPDTPGNAHRPDFQALRDQVSKSAQPEQLKSKQIEEINYAESLHRKVGPDAAGFQRLKMAFDLIVCRAHKLLTDLNSAISSKDPSAYENARWEYINFIRNLDNHEPERTKGAVDPQKCLGYGKNIKWVSIDPIIGPDPKTNGETNIITGATVVIKWNPHSSSSGIPVNH